ncbi:MAG: sulfotransferase [Candidatus Hodarchaeota archaeon]
MLEKKVKYFPKIIREMIERMKKSKFPLLKKFDKFRNRSSFLRIKSKFEKDPIIIGGSGRSGTTLLLSILSAHPNIFAISFETQIFCPTAYYSTSYSDAERDFDFVRLHHCLKDAGKRKSYKRWCEKTPKNVIFFAKILKYFKKNVRLIHIIRAGRDTILSRHPINPSKYWSSTKRWISDVKAGLKFKDHPQVLTIKYEDLVLKFKETIIKICNFIDEEVNEEIMNWHKYATVRKHIALAGEIKPIQKNAIGKWKHAEDNVRIREFLDNKDAINLLEQLGYA